MVAMSELTAVIKLMRLKMVFISGITYATGASMAMRFTPGNEMDVTLFALGYAFTFSCQMVAHLIGEYYDLPSDILNSQSSGMTGGSKVLVKKEIAPKVVLLLGRVCMFLCVTLLGVMCWLVSPDGGSDDVMFYIITLSLGFIMMTVAHQYSGPPFKLNHRGLGELCASCVMNVLLPWFAALLQASTLANNPLPLAPLIVPGFLLKFVLLLTLNVEDRRADWHSGKNTLAVLIGDEMSGKLQFYFTLGGYASVVMLGRWGMAKPSMIALLLVSAPVNIKIARMYNSPDRPYRMDEGIIRKVVELFNYGPSFSMAIRCLPLLLYILGFALKGDKLSNHSFQSESGRGGNVSASSSSSQQQILIVGGGVGGLTLAATLSHLNIPYTLFESRDVCTNTEKPEDFGVDLAVWPAATQILQELGVASGLWPQAGQSFPVHTMYMSALDGKGIEHTLKQLNMKAICDSTGEYLRLVARRVLMEDLRLIVPDYQKSTGKNVQGIIEDDENPLSVELDVRGSSGNPPVRGRVIIGCDGVGSSCRSHITRNRMTNVRQCGEVCYRGTIDLRPGYPGSKFSNIFNERDRVRPRSMTVTYGDGIRFSWGYLDESRKTGYWFVKQLLVGKTEPTASPPYHTWPEPIRTFAKHCGDNVYVHPILDLPYLEKWSCGRVALLGDACHAVTANSGQGACMAIEDAFVLGLLLRRYWGEPDGHIEAFYQYERERKPHVIRVSKDAQTTLRLGQLTSPWAIYLRNIFLKLMPVKVVENKLRKANLYRHV